MNIVVCIKQTPATTNVQIDPKTGTLRREGVAAAVNPFDEYAIEEGVRIRERIPGSCVSVLTMGPPQAEEALRDAIARGADDAFHLCGPEFKGADTWATSYTLQMGVRKIATLKGPVDLIICGKQSNDGDTGHVGPGIAAWLDWPNVAYVRKIEALEQGIIRVQRMMEDGTDVIEMDLPAVIAVVKEINEPRIGSLRGKMAAKKAVIPRWGAGELGCDPKNIGMGGSPTIVARSFTPPPRPRGLRIQGATVEDKAKALLQHLKDLRVL